MSEQQPGDLYSPRTVRAIFAVNALVLAGTAVFLVSGWLVWLFAALAVISGCVAITPPFRRPN